MARRSAEEGHPAAGGAGALRRLLRALVLGVTLIFVLFALLVSSALVVYTAWRHDLRNGVFALTFAVLSAQIALNWLLWRSGGEAGEEDFF
ncbi:hypothetical protein Rxyl_1095 [Rubrobacter xylanophilus DSM 9941]|uniref:Uncharacterized protein n=1 Tax=Rubrobacter xylanophilus (strain DSM 9941 / JCM 11954 / NBRC 16129 / PRD-1) TaxID=266117 RepID=Q1AX17_RUBXD|nr:hypothetical protein [Rubrobacter xylanophilus]ABG04061.1 hypothetical protein Rxyl_1095 [Rubrobacter xylanophilus DSM 9941]